MISFTGPSRKDKYPQAYQGRGQHLPSKVGPVGLIWIGSLHFNCGSCYGHICLPKVTHCTSLPTAVLLFANWIFTKLIYGENHKQVAVHSPSRGLPFGGYNKKRRKFIHLYEEKYRYISPSRWAHILNSKSGSTKKVLEPFKGLNESQDWREDPIV